MSVTAIALALVSPISELLKEVIPDADKRDKLAHELATMSAKQGHEAVMAQVNVNKQEAEHSSVFVAGWRPFLGWVGGAALANNYLLVPYVAAFGNVVIPVLDFSVMMPILMGMLGLTAARSYEKVNGVARGSLRTK